MSVITCRSNLLRGSSRTPRQVADCYYTYVGGSSGAWKVTQSTVRSGEPLPAVTHIDIVQGRAEAPSGASWILSGLVRSTRYVSREDSPHRIDPSHLDPTCAALILIRRSSEWWKLGTADQNELLQPPSRAANPGLRSLSSMLRRWQHRCDLSEQFDCVTWFEYEPRDATAFDDLLADWRGSEEWAYVDRECDLRLVRAA